MSALSRPAGWRLNPLVVAVTVVAVLLAAAAVLTQRADLLVVAVPLAAVAVQARMSRPTAPTRMHAAVDHPVVGEGAVVDLAVDVEHDPAAESLGLDLAPGARVACDPPEAALHRALTGPAAPGARDQALTARVEARLSPTAWGRRRVGGGEARLLTAWGGYVCRVAPTPSAELLTLPRPARLPLRSDHLSPAHLVGRHLSRRPGEGSEFAEIREFRPGDRIRRIHWPTSARTGALHVRTSYAEQDTQVVVLLDVLSELPHEDPARPGSIETAVRCAATVAAHFVEAGDRVGLRVVGDGSVPVPAGTGRRHLQVLLGALARIDIGAERHPDVDRVRLGLQPGSLVIALTPLTSPVVVDALAGLAHRGVETAVLDVAPTRTATTSHAEDVAWRILALQRARTTDLLRGAGVPVVAVDDQGGVGELLHGLQARRRAVRT